MHRTNVSTPAKLLAWAGGVGGGQGSNMFTWAYQWGVGTSTPDQVTQTLMPRAPAVKFL